MPKVCGDFGGRTQSGDKCTRVPGWGRDDVDEGKCKSHSDEKNSKIQEAKKRFVELLREEAITVRKASENLNLDRSTIWRWQQNDPNFDEEVQSALERQDEIRLEAVEDALFRDCVSGKATGTERIFWLKVFGGNRYQQADQKGINHSVDEDTDSGVMVVPGIMDSEEKWSEEVQDYYEQEKGNGKKLPDGPENES